MGLYLLTFLSRNLGGTLIEGSDTSSASLQNAVLILTRFPHVQVKARAEIDRVIGGDRVPAWEDLPNLPYTMAVIEEVFRAPFPPSGNEVKNIADEPLSPCRSSGPPSCNGG